MALYRTLIEEGVYEEVIDKSRFIGHAKPVESREAAEAYIAELRKEYKDATHNVPAMVLGDQMQIQWASEDGEPQGTAGTPILHMLVMEGLSNLVVVITRYFGGIKLGTGGLVRAYTGIAKKTIEAAGIGEVMPMVNLTIIFQYSVLDKLKHLSYSLKSEEDSFHFKLENLVYGEQIEGTLVYKEEFEEKIISSLANLTGDSHIVVARVISLSKVRISQTEISKNVNG